MNDLYIKPVIVRAFLLLVTLVPTLSFAYIPTHFYLNAGLGGNSAEFGPTLALGYQINNHVGIEASYLDWSGEQNGSLWNSNYQEKWHTHSASLRSTLRYQVSGPFYVGAKGGLSYSSTSYSNSEMSMVPQQSNNPLDLTIGLFLAANMNSLSLQVSHDIIPFGGQLGVQGLTFFNVGFAF
ncbi:outer membrane beta-barrel protein [Vibrio methylphosphonaticus]|uniref:outer membrane beta-barrel protein n=1 Tax=Vibrio methylphosphonaticus TaxID=2946866 RepID=UPI00202AB21F|nr:outer membrane beta-barrel protein [Vibrio methylphosphonaticus]MCL9773704.1 outer membrane beta-barrel protein [Vibrio methylphosphonaticus]